MSFLSFWRFDASEASMATLFGIAVTIVILGFLWFYVARPILEDFGLIEPRAVSYYQVDNPASVRVMSRTEERTAQTNQTNGANERTTEADLWIDRIQVDRTKTALIELLVYNEWTVTEIRSVLKGESATLGQEIDAARKRLGVEPPVAHITPIARRPTSARFETDPELAYDPLD